MTGLLVVSLDFELHWGVRDRRPLADAASDLMASRKIIPKILALFAAHQVRATWATVGLMFFASRPAMMAGLPTVRPAYAQSRYDSYADLPAVGADEAADPYHYGPSLIDAIARCPGQEIGTHTFSHYFALEEGQSGAAFAADLQAAARAARPGGRQLRSLVFPRNQCNPAYLPLCGQAGIATYRGNPASWLYRGRPRSQEGRLLRALRLIDAYVNLSGHHTYPRSTAGEAARAADMPLDVPASRFLRPWSSRLRVLEPLRLRRIKRAMTHAARRGEVFHLWWHPENFGSNGAENLAVLSAVLEHFRRLRALYGMQSCNMGDFAPAPPVAALSSTEDSRLGCAAEPAPRTPLFVKG